MTDLVKQYERANRNEKRISCFDIIVFVFDFGRRKFFRPRFSPLPWHSFSGCFKEALMVGGRPMEHCTRSRKPRNFCELDDFSIRPFF